MAEKIYLFYKTLHIYMLYDPPRYITLYISHILFHTIQTWKSKLSLINFYLPWSFGIQCWSPKASKTGTATRSSLRWGSHKFLSFGSSQGNPRKSNTCFSVSNFKLALPLVCALDAVSDQHEKWRKKERQEQSETYVSATKQTIYPFSTWTMSSWK